MKKLIFIFAVIMLSACGNVANSNKETVVDSVTVEMNDSMITDSIVVDSAIVDSVL